MDVDSFSCLLDHLLIHILSFLSTTEAAKTSVLSTRWRHLWKLTGRLFLLISPIKDELQCEKLIDSILSSFENPNLYPLREVFICTTFDNDTAEHLISFAIDRHNVQSLGMLHYYTSKYVSFPLPSSHNRMNNLMHLKLFGWKILPSFECFRNLRSICLDKDSIVTDAAFESINLNCTLLEQLILFHVRELEQIRVSSSLRRLKHLAICDCDDLKTAFIESPSLEKLEVGMGGHWKPASQGLQLFAPRLKELTLHSCEDMSATLAIIEGSAIGRIEKLDLVVNDTRDLYLDSPRPRRLNHVKELSLKVSKESEDLSGLEALLTATSSLESLNLSFGRHVRRWELPDFHAPISVGNLKLQSLERIRIQVFDHREYSHLRMLKYLAEVAVRLVEIKITVQPLFSEDFESKKRIEDCIGDKPCGSVRLVILPDRRRPSKPVPHCTSGFTRLRF